MPRVNAKSISPQEKEKYLDLLWTSILTLKTKEEVKNFFKDLLSEQETIMIARRILIAKELLQGKGYDQIREEHRVGKSTIASVQHWLMHGFGGFEKTSKEIKKSAKQNRGRGKKHYEYADPFSIKGLKKRYPLHFFLLNLADHIEDRKTKRKKK